MGHTYRAFGLEPIGTWVRRLDTPRYARPVFDVDTGTERYDPTVPPQPFA